MSPAEVIGWAGFLTYLASYALLAVRILGRDRVYFVLNVVAALAVVVVGASTGTWQTVVLNLLWAVISGYGFFAAAPPVSRVRRRTARAAVAVLVGIGLVLTAAGGLLPPLSVTPALIHLGVALLGWASVVAFLLGYALFVARRIRRTEFHLFNLVAALAMVPQAWVHGNAPVVALEIAWALVAVAGLLRRRRR